MSAWRGGGFSLLELMVVLAIAALVMAVTPPLLSRAMPGLQLKSNVREVAAAMRQARERAVATRSETLLVMDLEQRTLGIEGLPRRLNFADEFEISLVSARDEMQDETQGAIRFYPDGSSTGGRISLKYADQIYDVDLDWLTGRVSIAQAQAD